MLRVRFKLVFKILLHIMSKSNSSDRSKRTFMKVVEYLYQQVLSRCKIFLIISCLLKDHHKIPMNRARMSVNQKWKIFWTDWSGLMHLLLYCMSNYHCVMIAWRTISAVNPRAEWTQRPQHRHRPQSVLIFELVEPLSDLIMKTVIMQMPIDSVFQVYTQERVMLSNLCSKCKWLCDTFWCPIGCRADLVKLLCMRRALRSRESQIWVDVAVSFCCWGSFYVDVVIQMIWMRMKLSSLWKTDKRKTVTIWVRWTVESINALLY